MRISVSSNVQQFRRDLRRLEKDAKFATARGLTRTAQKVKSDTERHIERVFDRPTPFTKRGVFFLPAEKRAVVPSALVGIKDAQAGYLLIQETGGLEIPENEAFVVPVKARTNKYGNLSRNKVQQLLSKPNTFSGEVNGVGGIWQRIRRGRRRSLKLLILYKQRRIVQPRFNFYENAELATRRHIDSELLKSFDNVFNKQR